MSSYPLHRKTTIDDCFLFLQFFCLSFVFFYLMSVKCDFIIEWPILFWSPSATVLFKKTIDYCLYFEYFLLLVAEFKILNLLTFLSCYIEFIFAVQQTDQESWRSETLEGRTFAFDRCDQDTRTENEGGLVVLSHFHRLSSSVTIIISSLCCFILITRGPGVPVGALPAPSSPRLVPSPSDALRLTSNRS